VALHRSWALDDRRALTRTLGLAGFFIVILTVVLEQPFLTGVLHPFSVDPKLLLYLVPQALPIAVTVGATLGIVFGLGGRPFSRRVRAWIVGLALVASVASFVDLAWITPAANQAFRIIVSGHADLLPGAPELTLGELGRQIELSRHGETALLGDIRNLAFNYHIRWALACSPLVLVMFAFSMLPVSRVRGWAVGVAACGAFVGYYMLLYGGRRLVLDGSVPAYAAAWVPNLCIGLVSMVFTAIRSRRLGLAR
jgi:lipopolysaccharide export LptBFGC system permease protein LptF